MGWSFIADIQIVIATRIASRSFSRSLAIESGGVCSNSGRSRGLQVVGCMNLQGWQPVRLAWARLLHEEGDP